MVSTSFGSRNPGSQPGATLQPPAVALPGKNPEQGTEALRVKNFIGQRKFHAPAADDFIKGMLPDGQLPATETSVLRHFFAALGWLVGAMQRLWPDAKPTSPGSRKAD